MICAAEMSTEAIVLSTPKNKILLKEDEGVSAKPRDEVVLKDVVACVEVRTKTENRSRGVAYQLEQLGAKVVTKLDNDVTHVIWKDGRKPTLERARKRGLHVVSVLWVESCKQNQEHVAERMFAVTGQEEGSPLFVPKMKRRKFMEPKDLEEDLQDSRERLAKRRKKQDAPLTVSIPGRKVLVEDTPYRHSPSRYLPGPPFSPSLIPHTPDSMRACLNKLDSIKAQSPFVYQKPTLGDSPTCGTFNCSDSPSNSPLERREVVGSLIDRLLASDTDEPSPLERVCLKTVGSKDAQSQKSKLSKALFQFESSSKPEVNSTKPKSEKLRKEDLSHRDSSSEATEWDDGMKGKKRKTRMSLGQERRKTPQGTSVEGESTGDKRTEPLVLRETSVRDNGVTQKRSKSLNKKGKTIAKLGLAVDGDIDEKEKKGDVSKASENIENVNSADCLSEQSRNKSDLMKGSRVLEEEALPTRRRRSCRGVKSLSVKEGSAREELSDKPEVSKDVVASRLCDVDGTEARQKSDIVASGSQLSHLGLKDKNSHKEIREQENVTGRRLSRKTRGQDSRIASSVTVITLDSPEENISGKNNKENVKNSDDLRRQEEEFKGGSTYSRKGQDEETDKGNDRTPGQKRPRKDPGEEGEGKRRPKRRKLLRMQTYEEPPSTLIDPVESVKESFKSGRKTTDRGVSEVCQDKDKEDDGSLRKMRKRNSSKTKKDEIVQLSQPDRRSLEDFKDVAKKSERVKSDDGDKSEDSGIESSKNVSMDSSGSPTNDSDGKDESCQDPGGSLKRNKASSIKPPSKPRKPTVVMTSLHRSEQDVIVSVIRKLGGFKITDSVDDSTTHVIIGDPRRTLNVLSAIGHGCWLLSKEWVLNSLESGHWLPEEPFEIHSVFPSAKLSRELKAQSMRGQTHLDLFSEFGSIFVSESSSPPSERLADLIVLCGGSVSKGQRQADLCIGKATVREDVTVVQEKWVLDCISELKPLPMAPYKLNSR